MPATILRPAVSVPQLFGADKCPPTVTVLYQISALVLSENIAIDIGKDGNDRINLLSNGIIMKYLKDAFVYVHKDTYSLANQSSPRRFEYNAAANLLCSEWSALPETECFAAS